MVSRRRSGLSGRRASTKPSEAYPAPQHKAPHEDAVLLSFHAPSSISEPLSVGLPAACGLSPECPYTREDYHTAFERSSFGHIR